MANRPIKILKVNTDNTLALSDHGKTKAKPGDTITWKIGKRSGVGSITSISKKVTSANVFNPLPAPLGASGQWRGTIDSSINKKIEEEYSIGYKKSSGGTYIYDPKIAVRPTLFIFKKKFILFLLALFGLLFASQTAAHRSKR